MYIYLEEIPKVIDIWTFTDKKDTNVGKNDS